MKRVKLIFASILFLGFAAIVNADELVIKKHYTNSYGSSFIFQEQGIEFSIFPDGQFDFHMLDAHSGVSVSVNNRYSSFSFNTGYNYDAYVQYDEFGAVVQVEHVPVYYDHFGRIARAGNVFISYNNYGYVSRVGGLYVYYNNHHRFSHCSGFINVHNRHYVFRPWHRYYVIPPSNYCVVYNRPYRKFYKPKRFHYNGYYKNNHRRTTAVANRRGSEVRRNMSYATVKRSRGVRVERNNRGATVRNRNNTAVSTHRKRENNISSRRGDSRNMRSVNERGGRVVASSNKKATSNKSYKRGSGLKRNNVKSSTVNRGRRR